MEKVEFLVELLGDQECLTSIKNMENALKRATAKKFEAKIEYSEQKSTYNQILSHIHELERKKTSVIAEWKVEKQQEYENLEKQLKDLENRKNIALKVDIDGIQEAATKLDQLKERYEGLMRALNGASSVMVAGANGIEVVTKDTVDTSKKAYEQQLDYTNKLATGYKNDAKAYKESSNEIRKEMAQTSKEMNNPNLYSGAVKEMNNAIRESKQEAKELGDAMNDSRLNIQDANTGAEILRANIKEAKQESYTFRDALSDISSLFTTIGGALQSMGSFFGSDVLNTIEKTLTGYMTILGTQGLGKSISRYDTFKTYPTIMEALGYSADQAQASIDKLNNSVLGLPTALDDIVTSAKQFTMIFGDLEKGTDLAISLNNALLASGASESMQSYSQQEVYRLVSGGKLNGARQWNALLNGLGVSVQYIGQELGYSTDQVGKFREACISGEVSSEDFINALIKAGQAKDGIAGLTSITKTQLSSAVENIKIAFANLGASVLEELDTSLSQYTGKGLVDTVKDVSTAIKQNLIPAIREWIRANPETITKFLEKIKNYDWMGLLSKVGSMAMKYFDIITTIYSKIPTEVTAFGMTLASPLGKAFTALGSIIGAMAKWSLPEKAINAVKKLFGGGGVFSTINSGGGAATAAGNTMTSISEAWSNFGLKAANVALLLGSIASAGLIVKEFASIAEYINGIELGDGFENKMSTVLKLSGIVGGVVTAITGIMTALQKAGMGKDVIIGEGLAAGVGALMAEYEGIMYIMSKVISSFAGTMNDISAINITSDITSKVKQMALVITELSALVIGEGFVQLMALAPSLLGSAGISIVKSTIKSICSMFTSLSETEIPTTTRINRVKNVLVQLRDVFDNDFSSMLDEIADATDADITGIENMATIMEDLQKVADTLVCIGSMDFSATDIQKAGERATQVVKALGSAFTNMKSAFGVTDWNAEANADSSDSLLHIMNNMQTVITNVQTTITTISDMSASLASITRRGNTEDTAVSQLDKAAINIKKVVTALGDILQTIKDAFSDGGTYDMLIDETSSETGGTIIGNLNTAFTTVQSVCDTVASMSEKLRSLTKESRSGSQLDTFASDMKKVINSLGSIFMTFKEAFDSPTYRGLGNDAKSSNSMSKIVSNLNSMIAGLSSIIDTMQTASNKIQFLDNAIIGNGDDKGKSLLTRSVENIQEFCESLAAMYTDLGNNINTDTTNAENIKLWIGSAADSIESIVGILESVTTNQATIEALVPKSEFVLGTKLATITKGLATAFEGLNADGDKALDYENVATGASNISTAMNSVAEILSKVMNLQATVDALVSEEGTFALGDKLGTIFDKLGTAFGKITGEGGLVDKLTGGDIPTVIGNFGESLKSLASGSVDALEGSVTKLCTAMEKLKTDVDNAKTSLEGFQPAIDNLKASIGTASDLFARLANNVLTMQSNMNGAITAVGSLTNALNLLPSRKTVTLTTVTNTVGSTIGSAISKVSAFKANGGVIYRANGGFTTFIPRGTDTVPAMLTPGEFVMRRKAVQAYGAEFMKRINALDIRGAVNALSLRNGGAAMPRNSSTYTITNNRDNHATVNQKIYTKNQNFTLRRANRWVRALG